MTYKLKPELQEITDTIVKRSAPSRRSYLAMIESAGRKGTERSRLSCTNLAHNYAATTKDENLILRQHERSANIAIISSYNDLLSAHQPYSNYPAIIKRTIAQQGHVAQFAAGVPAMCDGVTEGQAGMELSLFSRDVIAMATSVALSHQLFDGVVLLGVCNKIVPGLLIAALRFGHLPSIFIPSGPMPTGISYTERDKVREKYAQGKTNRETLLEMETGLYSASGTCTFYGTANSNQMLMEIMGLQLPGSAFVPTGSSLREVLTKKACERICQMTQLTSMSRPLGHLIDEKSIVNGIVGLMATGGSTNHTIHLIAIARAAGILINWDDFSAISKITPRIARIYPDGEADINEFHQQGGMSFIIQQLLKAGLLHEKVKTVMGGSLSDYTYEPYEVAENVAWNPASHNLRSIEKKGALTSFKRPFGATGGITLLEGNIGRAIVRTSGIPEELLHIRAQIKLFTSQKEFRSAFKKDQLKGDFVAVVHQQGPKANGMPELNKLIHYLSILQQRGQRVALVTDGRLSGNSAKVLAAVHVTPESASKGMLARLRSGDYIEIDTIRGIFEAISAFEPFDEREPVVFVPSFQGNGRELFSGLMSTVNDAELGATTFTIPVVGY